MAAPRVLRSPASRVLWTVVGAFLIVPPVLAVPMLLASGDGSPAPVGLYAGLAVLVLCGVAALRLAVVRVVLHDDHVEIVNPLRRFRFYWNDVDDIDVVSSGGWIVRVWAGGVPRWAWGVSRFGKFGLPSAVAGEDPAQDAPRQVYAGYRELRSVWRKRR